MIRRYCLATLGVAAVLTATVAGADAAQATNPGTVSGNLTATDSCTVDWRASTVMDPSLTNDDPEYPGLMVDADGNPVAYQNGGYIQEVSPLLGDPGYLELQHFYVANTQVWRIPVATTHAMRDAELTFEAPEQFDGQDVSVVFDGVSINDRIAGWGDGYAQFAWSERTSSSDLVDNGDGTWTLEIGDLGRGQGTVVQFNLGLGGTGLETTDRFVASASLTATYAPGNNGGNCEIPDAPTLPVPDSSLPVCSAEFLGQTLWAVADGDITKRTKIQGDEVTDETGEVNADDWGAGADAWGEGDTRNFRLYAATAVELTDVTYVIDAVQGLTLGDVAATVSTPGAGALQGNGYTEAVDGVTVTKVNETQVRIEVESMPAMSSLSLSAQGVLDGTGATMALDHRLTGTVVGCEQPEPRTTTGEWAATAVDCEDAVVTESREVTTTTYAWNLSTLAFDEVTTSTTETRERPMTDAERSDCAAASTQQPGDTAQPDSTSPSAEDGGGLASTGGDGAMLIGLGTLGALIAAFGLALFRRRSAQ